MTAAPKIYAFLTPPFLGTKTYRLGKYLVTLKMAEVIFTFLDKVTHVLFNLFSDVRGAKKLTKM